MKNKVKTIIRMLLDNHKGFIQNKNTNKVKIAIKKL